MKIFGGLSTVQFQFFAVFLHQNETAQSSEKSQKINTTESENGSDNFYKIFELDLIGKF